jgi:hypothetical protein
MSGLGARAVTIVALLAGALLVPAVRWRGRDIRKVFSRAVYRFLFQ